MSAKKISVTIEESLLAWARATAERRQMALSAVLAEALERQRQHQARERYLKKALASLPRDEVASRTAEAYRQIFGGSDSP